MTATGEKIAAAPALDEIRSAPVSDPILLRSIQQTLDALPTKTATVVLQVPEAGVLRAAVFANVGHGLSFVTWGEKLKARPGLGFGVAVRKSWGSDD